MRTYFKKWIIIFLMHIIFIIPFKTFASYLSKSESKISNREHVMPLSLQLKNTYLPDAIRLMAGYLHLNIIISPSIQGDVSLQFAKANPYNAFNLLLASYGLTKWQIGDVWYIAPQEELIKQKETSLKWQETQNGIAQLITKIWQIKYAKAEEIVALFQKEQGAFLSKRGNIYVDVRTNSICIQDIAQKIVIAEQLIKRLDVPLQQIAILVRLVAIDTDVERELGIHFAIKQVGGLNDNKKATQTFNQESGRYSLAIVKLADSSLLDVKLSALENAGRAELISSPSLFTANQQSASIEAGEEVPYQEISENGGTAFVFKKAVLGLKVTPQILPGHKVLLQLKINQDKPSNKMVLGMPTISTRQIMTNVLIKNGQTIVLGGIYETTKEMIEERVPFISQIPLLGFLFKQNNKRESKRELLIFVTPEIIA